MKRTKILLTFVLVLALVTTMLPTTGLHAAQKKGVLRFTKTEITIGNTEKKVITDLIRTKNISGSISYSSSDRDIVTLNQEGLIRAKKTGTAIITIKAKNADPASLTVHVMEKPTKMSLNITEISLNQNSTKWLKATLNDGAFGDIVFTSSDEKIATVSSAGKITAVKTGSCTVTATTFNGLTASVAVTVRPDMKDFSLSAETLRVPINTVKTLSVIYSPANSYNKITYSSSNPKVATVSATGEIKGLSKGTAVIRAYCEATGETKACSVEVYYTKQIAVTFDDGPGPYGDTLLDALAKYDSKATFFFVGNRVATYKKEVKRAYEEGHEIGGHSWDHERKLNSVSAEEVARQVNKTNTAIRDVIGVNPTVFRPPWGSYNSTVREKAGVPVIIWNLDTEDWRYRDSARLKNYLINNAKDGQIILMHEIHKTTIDGFLAALPELKKMGFELVTVTELLTRDGSTPEPGSVHSKGAALK